MTSGTTPQRSRTWPATREPSGAASCFTEHGYEGATIAKLERLQLANRARIEERQRAEAADICNAEPAPLRQQTVRLAPY